MIIYLVLFLLDSTLNDVSLYYTNTGWKVNGNYAVYNEETYNKQNQDINMQNINYNKF